MRHEARAWVGTIVIGGVAATASAGEPARVATPVHVRLVADDARFDPAPPAGAAASSRPIRLDEPGGRWRRGIGGTLVNLLPFASNRFHVSAGGRLFGRARGNPALDERGLLSSPRIGGGARSGGRRFAPALLMGVDRQAGTMSVGVDAGLVMGAAMDRGMRGLRGFRRAGGATAAPNGIARITIGYRF